MDYEVNERDLKLVAKWLKLIKHKINQSKKASGGSTFVDLLSVDYVDHCYASLISVTSGQSD